MTADNELPKLPKRPAESHKGDYGRVMLVGGSRGMTGAITLAGMAALRSGAGLVRLAVPGPCLNVVAGFEPSYMTVGLPADDNGQFRSSAATEIQQQLTWATCVACGPGLGQSSGACALASSLYRQCTAPAVFDADALNNLSAEQTWLAGKSVSPMGPRILTPHVGEFRRMLGDQDKNVDIADMAGLAQDLAARCRVVVVLKGHQTLITDGEQCFHNHTGNPGMATGGTGDVLTGIITALVGQGLSVLDAARLGVYVHGLAGDLAAEQLGQVSMIASDLVRFLPAAFSQLADSKHVPLSRGTAFD